MQSISLTISAFDVIFLSSFSSCLKLLFMPSYYSTDFEVHRNWLALTHSLPISQWYFEKTSEWTLDYPPLFAWFEYLLSLAANFFEKEMLNINNLNWNTHGTIYFQRISVICSDFVLHFSVYKLCKSIYALELEERRVISIRNKLLWFAVLVIFNAGLIIVDHIHFQYNGFLFGILFLSIANMMDEKYLWGSFWFAVVLNFKHIFLYIAPAYGIFLLRFYCTNPAAGALKSLLTIKLKRLFNLVVIVCAVFLLSFGPFLNHLPQVLSRLFPFKRGLTHAYWAPNFWALYNFLEKIISVIGNKLGIVTIQGSMLTKGLVGEFEYNVLPQVPPIVTGILTLLAMMPCLLNIWLYPNSLSRRSRFCQFLRAVVITSMCSFMFGWHVHEKAILMVILPLTILMTVGTRMDVKIFLLLQFIGHYSLFPLLFTKFENISKLLISTVYSIAAFSSYRHIVRNPRKPSGHFSPLNHIETLYMIGAILNEIYCSIVHWCVPSLKKYEFLPLMLTSTYCAVGVIWCWLKLYYTCLYPKDSEDLRTKLKIDK